MNVPTFKFFTTETIKSAAASADGLKRVVLTASSNADDLIGDVMSDKALRRMKEAAPGMTMFLNHKTQVPEDVFGTVESAEMVTRKAQLVNGKQADVQCLDFTVIVDETNPRAINTFEKIEKGIVKLGASVTVAVLEKAAKPNNAPGQIIDDVYYLETSIVGMPMNRQSFVQYARKALELAGESDTAAIDSSADAVNSQHTLKTHDKPTESADATKPVNSSKSVETAEKSQAKTVEAPLDELDASPVTSEMLSELSIKGLFNEAMAKRKPSPWTLWDVLCTVVYKLARLKDANVSAGVEDDDFDYKAALQTAIAEFGAALEESFAYHFNWEKESDASVASYSVQVKAALETLQKKYESTEDEASKNAITETGQQLLEIAAKMGIQRVAQTASPAEISDDVIRKSAIYAQLDAKLKTAESERDAANTETEKWKAIASLSKSALEKYASQPLESSAHN